MLAAQRTSRLHAAGGGLHHTAHAPLRPLVLPTAANPAASIRPYTHLQPWQALGQQCMAAAPTTFSSPQRQVRARGVTFEGGVPEGVQVEVKGPQESSDVDWDASTKTLRLPYNVVEASGERRTKLVIFTCNKCGGRTARNVNPIAWDKGLVMGQCAHCQVWHVLSAKNPLIYEEIRYREDPRYSADTDSSTSNASSDTVDGMETEASSSSSSSNTSNRSQQPEVNN